jgi:hypothetical protein
VRSAHPPCHQLASAPADCRPLSSGTRFHGGRRHPSRYSNRRVGHEHGSSPSSPATVLAFARKRRDDDGEFEFSSPRNSLHGISIVCDEFVTCCAGDRGGLLQTARSRRGWPSSPIASTA